MIPQQKSRFALKYADTHVIEREEKERTKKPDHAIHVDDDDDSNMQWNKSEYGKEFVGVVQATSFEKLIGKKNELLCKSAYLVGCCLLKEAI